MGKANAKRIGEDERSPPCPTHGQSLATAVTAGKSGKGRKRARWAARKAARAARTSGASGDANGIADGEGEDGLLRYARSCEHTRSVHIDWVPIRETQIGIRRGQGQGEGGGGRKRAKKRARTVVVTTTSIDTGDKTVDATSPMPATEGEKGRRPQLVAVVRVKPLLVLDINGILCRRIRRLVGSGPGPGPGPPWTEDDDAKAADRTVSTTVRWHRPAVGHVAETPVVPRTDLVPFLSFLDSRFTLAVWTSAKPKTARALVRMLFPPDIASRLLFVWGQNRCDSRTLPQPEGTKTEGLQCQRKARTVHIKRLGKVWAAHPLWDESNSLCMDDTPEKIPDHHLGSTLHPPPILGSARPLEDFRSELLNQERQATFFHELAEFWDGRTKAEDEGGGASAGAARALDSAQDRRAQSGRDIERLRCWLLRHATGHMGWRGNG